MQKLDQLRMLRREHLKREGHFFPEEDQEFYERIQQQEQDLARRKKEQEEHQEKKKQARSERLGARQQRMAQRKLKQSEESAIGSNDGTKDRKGRVKRQKLKEPTPSETTHPTLLPPSPDFLPPHATAQTLQPLGVPPAFIELSEQEACDRRDPEEIQMNRELWAHYVVDEDSPDGSCIPLDLGEPPPPSSHFWAALLIK